MLQERRVKVKSHMALISERLCAAMNFDVPRGEGGVVFA